jgi:hypothetical protein
MAAVSLARGRSSENAAPSSHADPLSFEKIAIEPSTANQVQRKRTSPDEAGRDLCGEISAVEPKYQNIARGWVNCASA